MKKIHWFLALWALIVAVLFNVDTLSIARALLDNPKLRASLVAAAAEETVKSTYVPPVGNRNRKRTRHRNERPAVSGVPHFF
jgi:hypothetical protein